MSRLIKVKEDFSLAFDRVNNLSEQPLRDQLIVECFENWFSQMTHIPQTTHHKLSIKEVRISQYAVPHYIRTYEKD